MGENLTFWTILPLRSKMYNWSSEAFVNAWRAFWARIKGKNSNIQLVMNFGDFLIL